MQEDESAAHFQAMAQKCRKLAASTDDPRAIDSLRKLAEEYEKAAEAAPGAALAKANGKPFRRLDEG